MTEPIIDDSRALAVRTELTVVTNAIEVSLGVRELTVAYGQRRDELTAIALAFTTPPEDDTQQDTILTAQRNVAKLRTELTKNADVLKGPLNTAKQRIIDLEKTEVAKLKKAEDHCAGLINHRQQKLLREQQEREDAEARLLKKIADDAKAAEAAQRQAEAAQRAAELAQQQAELARGRNKAAAAAAAAKAAEDARKAQEAALEASFAVEIAPKPVLEVASEAPQAKEFLSFEIEGNNPMEQKANAMKLLNAHSELFTFKLDTDKRGVSFTLRLLDIAERLNGKMSPPITAAPGIRITKHISKLR